MSDAHLPESDTPLNPESMLPQGIVPETVDSASTASEPVTAQAAPVNPTPAPAPVPAALPPVSAQHPTTPTGAYVNPDFVAAPPAPPTAPPATSRTAGILWLLLLVLVLLIAPTIIRSIMNSGQGAAYLPPATSAPLIAMTPEPTATAFALARSADAEPSLSATSRPKGPVVIDYAHFNQIDARGMQPLAAGLSRRGLSTRVWLTNVDPFAISSAAAFPDQSEDLAEQLRDASALIVISPYFFWSPQEIAVAENFVADGGRLLLISDPDIFGDSAVYNNLLSEPFGIVFNDDYLYDTVHNDENYTHFFQGNFLDQAQALDGLEIAFYGGRSISGDVVPQVLSAPTTLSSRRTGVSGFTTVAIGDNRGWERGGRVLAMSDFDVLTEPNVVRHDNQQLVEFVADFLSGGERNASIADFPAWLDRNVTLMIGSAEGLDAATLLVGANIQRRLEESGRTMTLAGAPVMPTVSQDEVEESRDNVSGPPKSESHAAASSPTPSVDATAVATSEVTLGSTIPPLPTKPSAEETTAIIPEDGVTVGNDVILLADYDYANDNTEILSSLGISLVIELVYPTPAATPASSATEVATLSSTITATIAATATLEISGTLGTPMVPDETPAPDATPEPPENVAKFVEPPTEPSATPAADDDRDVPGAPPPATPNESPEGTVAAPVDTTTAPTATVSITLPVTPTVAPSATPSPTPTPVEVVWLVSQDGLRLLADETALIIRMTETVLPSVAIGDDERNSVIVLGAAGPAISAGVERLLGNDFTDCIVGEEVTYCPVAGGNGTASTASHTAAVSTSTTASATPAAGSGTVTPPPSGVPTSTGSGKVLLIDDDVDAGDDEVSEADIYASALVSYGINADRWSTAESGSPTIADLETYKWVILSDASYANSEIDVSILDPLFAFLNAGGRITISSLKPFFAMGVSAPSTMLDVAVVGDVVDLSKGLPSPVLLVGDTFEVAPLAPPDNEDGFDITLARGSTSEDAGAPAVVSATDADEDEPTGAKLIVVGMSVAWLPTDFANQLINNMADWMLAE